MLPAWFVVFSVAIRLIGGSQYVWAIIKGKARPNPVTWLLWGLTPAIAFIAQIQGGFTGQSAVLLALATSPLVIFGVTVARHSIKEHLTPFAITCGVIALIGIVLWRITSLPELAIIFSIIADIFATLPTLLKTYKDRTSEYAVPYILSMLSMIITLLTIHDWAFTIYAFPLYMLGINTLILSFVLLPLRETAQLIRKRLSPVV